MPKVISLLVLSVDYLTPIPGYEVNEWEQSHSLPRGGLHLVQSAGGYYWPSTGYSKVGTPLILSIVFLDIFLSK
jgi:hypothetical protein